MIELKKELIKYALKLNSTNLSPLRSGNVSARVTKDNVEGFYLTPSGKRYEDLVPEDIVFLSIKEEYDNLKLFNSSLNPSSEWRFHQDIYREKKRSESYSACSFPPSNSGFITWQISSCFPLHDSASWGRRY